MRGSNGVRPIEEAGDAVRGSGRTKRERRLRHASRWPGHRLRGCCGDHRGGSGRGRGWRHRNGGCGQRRNETGTGVARGDRHANRCRGSAEQRCRMVLLLHHRRIQDDADHDRRKARRTHDKGEVRPDPAQPWAEFLVAAAWAGRPGLGSAPGRTGIKGGHAAESGFTQLCGPSGRGQGAAAPGSDDDAKWFLFSQRRREPSWCGSPAATGHTPRSPRRARSPA